MPRIKHCSCGTAHWEDAPCPTCHPIEDRLKRAEAERDSLQRENEEIRGLLYNVHITLRHARIFIGSREKMHPDGQGLYDELLEEIKRIVLTDGEEE